MSNQPSTQLNPTDTRATLGNLTHIMGHLIPQQQPDQSQNTAPEPPQNQQMPEDVNSQVSGLESRIFDELGTLREEIKKIGAPKDQNKELEDLKKQIETVLSQNE